MLQTQALQRNFDGDSTILNPDGVNVAEVFNLPIRNWSLLIDCYNEANKRKFPLTALECKIIIENVKKGHRPNIIFQTLGFSSYRYAAIVTKYNQAESRLMELQTKEKLSDDEYEEFQVIMRSPFRLLMSDIDRAEGASSLADWEVFNERSQKDDNLIILKMKAKNRDFFTEKENNAPASIVINIGGITLEE